MAESNSALPAHVFAGFEIPWDPILLSTLAGANRACAERSVRSSSAELTNQDPLRHVSHITLPEDRA